MIQLTGWQKQEILNELEIRYKNAQILAEKNKGAPTYLADTEYMNCFLERIEQGKKQIKELYNKIDKGEKIDDNMWVDLLCILTKYKET